MSAVDVLATMESIRSVVYGGLIDGLPGTDSPLDAQMVEAIAAVAELIEAAESARSSLQQLVDIGRLPPNSKGLRDVTAALARVGGAK